MWRFQFPFSPNLCKCVLSPFFLIVAILTRYGLGLHFISDLRCLTFIQTLAVCISTLKTYLFKFFACILTGLFAFLLLCYKGIFINPGYYRLLKYILCKCFNIPYVLFDKIQIICFYFDHFSLGITANKLWLIQSHEVLYLCFLLCIW